MKSIVLVIGAGVTGAGVARDLALRGVKCLVAERRDINAGASGGNHGLLHSGGRYVHSDPTAAAECHEESTRLKQLAPQCIESSGGLFVAVEGDDPAFASSFAEKCKACGVPCTEVSPEHARKLEPCLSDSVFAAYEVNDAAVDPFMLSLDTLDHARTHGAEVIRNSEIIAFTKQNGRITHATILDHTSGEERTIEVSFVINAGGAWAGSIAAKAGAPVSVTASQGTLLITQDRLAKRVINRLRPPNDADILVPGGTISILGTTSVRIDNPDLCRPQIDEIDRQIDDAAAMIPALAHTRFIRAYAGVRPLVSSDNGGDDRKATRGYSLIDHGKDGIDNFITITGGKLTTFRLMAEKAVDLACAKLGISAPCRTRTEPLPASNSGHWTKAGSAPRAWVDTPHRRDVILCECEMVSRSIISNIADGLDDMRGRSTLTAIGLRSRVGKGPCQGGFCGPRITAHLYDQNKLHGNEGIPELKRFMERRWRGKAPVLWDLAQMQADLQEALHCGVFDLELPPEDA